MYACLSVYVCVVCACMRACECVCTCVGDNVSKKSMQTLLISFVPDRLSVQGIFRISPQHTEMFELRSRFQSASGTYTHTHPRMPPRMHALSHTQTHTNTHLRTHTRTHAHTLYTHTWKTIGTSACYISFQPPFCIDILLWFCCYSFIRITRSRGALPRRAHRRWSTEELFLFAAGAAVPVCFLRRDWPLPRAAHAGAEGSEGPCR